MNLNLPLHKFAVLFITVLMSSSAWCQQDSAAPAKYQDLSLKDLLNVKIVSASKKQELLFDAPLSASVLTIEEIRKAGCNSIMEAMKLIPGMIVREQTNGNYDIHLRGMDNVPPNAPFDVTSNTTTLVMIDNRPVYSYLRGGTFWETLPVDLNDIEKIEVVRGPAAALFGPNAVNGVINIITRQATKDGMYIVANARQGSNHTFIHNASIGFRSGKWSVIGSGNYQFRDRFQSSYFEFFRNRYFDDPDYLINFNNDTVKNIKQLYPEPEMSMEKYAGNLFSTWSPADKIKFSLATGIQHSMAQRVSIENEFTPLSVVTSNSRYVDWKANLHGFSAQVSWNSGTQGMSNHPGYEYDYSTIEMSAGYSYNHGSLMLKPEFSYRKAVYDDTKYADLEHRAGLFNDKGSIISISPSLHAEYRLADNKLRLVGGVSANKFNYPDKTYLAYEFAATYKLNKNNLFRMVYSESPRSSNIFDTYIDKAIVLIPTGNRTLFEMSLLGNKELRLLTSNMLEVGYRGNITSHLSLDVELFDIRAKNFSIPALSPSVVEHEDGDTVYETPYRLTNLPMRLQQEGITITLAWTTKRWQFKPFVTLQHTEAKDYYPSTNRPDAEVPGAAQSNIYSGIGSSQTLKSTPTLFGGAWFNYLITPKLNLNVNCYYYTGQEYRHVSTLIFNDGVRGIDHINAKFILNSSISYEVAKGLHFSVTGKNLLNDRSREFFRTDEVPFRLSGGIHYEF